MYTATEEFKHYRNKVLGLKKEEFRKLQSGKAVEVPDKLVKQYPRIFKKEVKNATK